MAIKRRQREFDWQGRLPLWLLIVLFLAYAVLLYRGNQTAVWLARGVRDGMVSFWYDKDLRFSGLKVLKEKDFPLIAQRGRAVPWWFVNAPAVEAEILQNPMVSSVRMSRCHVWSWSCFDLKVQERNPVMLALVGERTWVVGDDGGFIAPLKGPAAGTQQLSQSEVAELLGSPVVEGLVPDASPPETIKPRLRYARQALGVLSAAGLDVKTLKLRNNGEMEVRFRGRELVAVFSLSADDMSRLDVEVQRLKRVLQEYGESSARIAQVDLAFEKQAVVRMQPTPMPTPARGRILTGRK